LTSLLVCCGIALQSAWTWPLTGDESLIHYVVLMLHAGRAPYSQIVEINLPGTYLLDYLAMNVFGWGAHGLRLYDGLLCFTLCWSAYLLGKKSRLQSLFCLAGALVFVLIHLQDGFDQAGQRDFALSVLTLCGINLLIRYAHYGVISLFLYELLIGLTLTIKPTLAPLALLPLLLDWSEGRKRSVSKTKLLLIAVMGLGTPWIFAVLWLAHFHSVHAFMQVMQSIGALHSRLGHKSFAYLLSHCTSPLIFLFILGLCVFFATPSQTGLLEKLLVWSVLCGLLSYIAQGKGLPYQRYPFLATSLVLIFLTFSKASISHKFPYVLSILGLLYASFWLAPRCNRTVRSFDKIAPFQEALSGDLRALDFGRKVQCLDTYGGCVNTLYDLRIPQATGYLYDCYLFGRESSIRDTYRTDFLQAFLSARPETVVVTNDRCFDPTKSFDRILEWPELSNELDRDYVVSSKWQSQKAYRSWSRAETPNSYKVYVHK
jgi:hypothetical protein